MISLSRHRRHFSAAKCVSDVFPFGAIYLSNKGQEMTTHRCQYPDLKNPWTPSESIGISVHMLLKVALYRHSESLCRVLKVHLMVRLRS